MVRVFCDKCGKDCELNAYEIRVEVIHNPTPYHALDIGDAKLSDVKDRCRFILCQDCYREMGMPNVYKVQDTRKVTFRDWEDDDNG